MPLSSKLAANVGKRTRKGTLITEGIVSSVRADEMGMFQITEDNTDAIVHALDKALVAALEECGLDGERFAKDNLTRNDSVDTGRLRNSVTHQLRESERAVYIGTNVEYGPYVEYGTEKSKPKPFLRPAAHDHNDVYEAAFRKHMGNANG